MIVEIIPSAKRLIRSLRDIGYAFVDAVADIVDNSVEAGASAISIDLKFDGEDSYLTIADNGKGMTTNEIHEALRFGSNRSYAESDDLGRYGLGLKTASLSQCECVTVSSRRGEERARINSFCWDLDHIENTNRWEILRIDRDDLKDEVLAHLLQTTGTVITWERLGRLLSYKYPSGEFARKQSEQMVSSLKSHLGMIFHRFLAGEVHGKRIAIYINGERVQAWDPYSRGEPNTLKLDLILIPLEYNGRIHDIKIQPYILPPQSLYSSTKSHLLASGPEKWNKQQGFYIYRSNRIIQAGGWSGLRTSDEHTKLVRMSMFIPSQLDELFQVNVAKKHANLPRDVRTFLLQRIQPIIQQGQEYYREKQIDTTYLISPTNPNNTDIKVSRNIENQISTHSVRKNEASNLFESSNPNSEYKLKNLIIHTEMKLDSMKEQDKIKNFIEGIYLCASENERLILVKLLKCFTST
jgi:hypothetical protein